MVSVKISINKQKLEVKVTYKNEFGINQNVVAELPIKDIAFALEEFYKEKAMVEHKQKDINDFI